MGVCRDRLKIGGARTKGVFSRLFFYRGGRVAWILRLVQIGTDGEGHCADVLKITRPKSLSGIISTPCIAF